MIVTGRREAVIWMLMLLLHPKVDSCNNHRDQGITWCEKGDQRASKTHYFDLRGHIPGILRPILFARCLILARNCLFLLLSLVFDHLAGTES
jgi:hypothetical protein